MLFYCLNNRSFLHVPGLLWVLWVLLFVLWVLSFVLWVLLFVLWVLLFLLYSSSGLAIQFSCSKSRKSSSAFARFRYSCGSILIRGTTAVAKVGFAASGPRNFVA